MGRRWVPIVIVVVGGVLGLAVAGFPSRRNDAPLRIQAVVTSSTTTSVVSAVTTTTATTTAPVHPPGEVRVTVVNASGVTGSATRVGTVLKSRGYDVKTPGADRKAQDTTVVMYRPGYDDEARALATALSLDPSVVATLDAAVFPSETTDVGVLVGTALAKATN